MKNLTKLTALTLTAALALTACGSSAATTAPAAESAAGSTAEAASGDLLSEIQGTTAIFTARRSPSIRSRKGRRCRYTVPLRWPN